MDWWVRESKESQSIPISASLPFQGKRNDSGKQASSICNPYGNGLVKKQVGLGCIHRSHRLIHLGGFFFFWTSHSWLDYQFWNWEIGKSQKTIFCLPLSLHPHHSFFLSQVFAFSFGHLDNHTMSSISLYHLYICLTLISFNCC